MVAVATIVTAIMEGWRSQVPIVRVGKDKI
jgi:hypothetical protein